MLSTKRPTTCGRSKDRVSVHTSHGAYLATATQTVSVAAVPIFARSGGATGGEPLQVAVFFNDGNPTGTYPVPGHSFTYTVDWGDGSGIGSYTAPTFGHVYSYDYSTITPTNSYEYTITASDDEYTATDQENVGVLPAGAGSVDLNLSSSTVEEGQPVSLTASFSDSNQGPDPGSQGADIWSVWWGDGGGAGGEIAGPSALPSYTDDNIYNRAGTYVVTAQAYYVEDEATNNGHNVSATETLIVTDAPGTLTATPDETTINRGDVFTLSDSLSDPENQGRQLWTVSWGDGSIDHVELPVFDPTQFTHRYTSAGSRDVNLTAVTEDATTYSTHLSVTVADPKPTVSVTSTDWDAEASESGQTAGRVFITRTGGDINDPLTVSYSLGGTLPSTAYIVSEAGTDHALVGTVTLPAGILSETLLITPREDHTPRWTETVDVSLSSSADCTVDSGNSAAGVYVTDDDAEVYLANGSGNQILDGSSDGKSNLVPLVLDLPEEVRNGAVITLTNSAPTEADVWMDASTSGTPVLGMVDGSPVSEVTWTQGVDDLAPSGKTTLWVGGTGGSASMDEIQFTLSSSDAGCTVDGTNSDPVVPQDPPAQGPTTGNAQSQRSTGIYVEIDSLYDPNETNPTGNIDGTTRNWLIGQMADLVAVVHAPGSWTIGESFQWNLPGNVLRAINETADTRQTVAVVPKGNVWSPNRLNWSTGTKRSELVWFWVSTSSPTYDSDQVSLTVSHVHGQTLTASTTFHVYSPSSSASVLGGDVDFTYVQSPPTPPPASIPGYSGWAIGLIPQGTVWTAAVANVSGFASGAFRFVQEIMPRGSDTTMAGHRFVPPYQGSWVLDTIDPYPAFYVPFNDGAAWHTGAAYGRTGDSPLNSVDSDTVESTINHSFKTYLMYLPSGNESEWVPLKTEAWSFYGGIQKINGVWTRLGSWWTSFPPFQPEAAEPVWNARIQSGAPWIQVS